MNVRRAVPEDAPAVAAFHVESWRAAYAGLMPQAVLDGLSVEKRAAMWRQGFAAPGPALNLVATDSDDTIVGFCVLGPTRDADTRDQSIGEIVAIYARPSRWRQGIGRALFEQALVLARAAGWRQLTLWVLHGNGNARAFYQRIGFQPDGAEKHSSELTGHELHEIRYRLPISSGT